MNRLCMKITVSTLCILYLGISSVSAHDKTFMLAGNGASPYSIVLSSAASPSEKHAAAELQMFLQMISAAFLPVISENTIPDGPCVFIGDCALLKARHGDTGATSCGNEEYIIKTYANGDLILAGGRLRGSLYAVYGFLEDILGCRWYTSRVSKIPRMDRIALPPLDIREKSFFEYREPFWKDAFDADWAARNRCNSTFAELDTKRGGRVNYRGIHTFNRLISAERYLENHPEYFSISEKKRQWNVVHSQLCLTNNEVRKALIPNLVEWIESDPEGTIFDVSQNDGNGNCQCEHCLRVDSIEGSPSGTLLRFVNPVADYIRARYPDKSIATFAYAYTLKPPKITKPCDFMIIRLCTSIDCHSHPLEKCPLVSEFYKNLTTWGKIAGKIYVWDYLTDFHHYLNPQPDIRAQIANIKLFAENSVSGIFAQGDYTSLGGSLAYLEAYLEAKLLWNPHQNADAIIDDFLTGYYGSSAPAIKRYIDLIEEKVENDNIHVWMANPWNISEYMTPEIIAEAENLFEEAFRLADNFEIAGRVEEASLPLSYVKLTLPRPHEIRDGVFAPVPPYSEQEGIREALDFFSTTKKHGITEYREGSGTETLSDFILANVGAHEVLDLSNDKIECKVIPGIGGRMMSLKERATGKEYIPEVDVTAEWYPVVGGISVAGWTTPDFIVDVYEPENNIIVSAFKSVGRIREALHLKRSYTLLNDTPGIEVSTVMRQEADMEGTQWYTFSPEFSLGPAKNIEIAHSGDGERFTVDELSPADSTGIRTFELYYAAVKWGHWALINRKNDNGIIISFTPGECDHLRITTDAKNNSVRIFLRAAAECKNKGDSVESRQTLKIVHNIMNLIGE